MEYHAEELYETLVKANNLLKSIPELSLQVEEVIRNAGLETTDFMHEIEFMNLNDEQCAELIHEMKAMRQHRRIAKDNQIVYNVLKDFYEKNNTFIRRLDDTLKSINKSIESRKNRVYEPRVRTEKGKIYANKAMDPMYQDIMAPALEEQEELQNVLN